MSETISPETTESIRALCRRISVAHDLDDEIQRELFSHMEDKLLGYLSGGEKVTEEDALILVREHFGKPEHIRFLLEDVHAEEDQISFVRKLGAIFAATFFFTFILKLFFGVFLDMVFLKGVLGFSLLDSGIPGYFFPFVQYFVSFSLFGYVIFRWRRGLECGRKQWFEILNTWVFLAIVFFLACIFPVILIKLIPLGYHPSFFFETSNQYLKLLIQTSVCLTWIWWFNTPLRRLRYSLLGFITWLYFFECWQSAMKAIMMMARHDPEKTIHYYVQFTSMYVNIFHFPSLGMLKDNVTISGLAAIGLYLLGMKLYDRLRKPEVLVIHQ